MKLLMTLLAVAMLVAMASAGYIGRGGWSSPLYYSRSYAPSYGGWGGYGGYGGYGGWRGGYSGWGGSGYGGWNRGWSGGWW